MKKCAICKEEKPLSEFNKNKRKKDGLSTDCKCCSKKYLDKYREVNKDLLLLKSREFKNKHRDSINIKNKERYHLVKKLDESFMNKKRLSNRIYKKKNKGLINSGTAKRYTAKLKRCCLTTESDFQDIKNIYKEASRLTASTGIKYHVDHIIPLQGKFVSGLHLPSNLQIITEYENCSKNNFFEV